MGETPQAEGRGGGALLHTRIGLCGRVWDQSESLIVEARWPQALRACGEQILLDLGESPTSRQPGKSAAGISMIELLDKQRKKMVK